MLFFLYLSSFVDVVVGDDDDAVAVVVVITGAVVAALYLWAGGLLADLKLE